MYIISNIYLEISNVLQKIKDIKLLVIPRPLIHKFFVVHPHEISTDMSLEERQNACKTLVTHVLKLTEDTSTEEDFGVSKTELILIQLKGSQHFLCNHFAINKSFRNCRGSQDGISVEIIGTSLLRASLYIYISCSKSKAYQNTYDCREYVTN